jgi:hypothetical protein
LRTANPRTVAAAAEELDVPYKTLWEAIKLKQAQTIAFGGQKRMTKREIERLRDLFSGAA